MLLGEQIQCLARRGQVEPRLLRVQGIEGALDRRDLCAQALHVRSQERPIVVGGREVRQRAAEPLPHLVEREGHGGGAHELCFEVVGLVDDEQPPARQVLAVPVAQGGEVRDVRAEEGPGEGRGLGPRVRAMTLRPAGASAHPLRGRHPRVRVALADIVVPSLHHLQLVAELALVLVLEQLLRGEQVGIATPPREGHGHVALAHARRRLHQEDARRPRIVLGLGNRIAELGEEAGLGRARRGAGREVGQEVVGAHAPLIARSGSAAQSRVPAPGAPGRLAYHDNHGGREAETDPRVLRGRARGRRAGAGAAHPRP